MSRTDIGAIGKSSAAAHDSSPWSIGMREGMLKRFIKRRLQAARSWLQDDVNTERQRFPKFAYGELNGILLQILKKSNGALRQNYTWGVLHAAHLARTLNLRRISAIEFGVAGGHGLISLEATADQIQEALGIEVEVYGFDTGKGLPKPRDYRDMPHIYSESTYPMDFEALRHRLKRARLVLGLIGETLPSFVASAPAPVGFIAVDVDLYSSTVQALKILESDQTVLLPRIHCYFDDIMGFSCANFNGERLAIEEFNETHTMRKISPIYGLKYFLPEKMANSLWADKTYMAHILDHHLYCRDDGMALRKEENL